VAGAVVVEVGVHVHVLVQDAHVPVQVGVGNLLLVSEV
jgi:hypothetical protein